ncbi:hypothetical protein RvY_00539 [Ramazzottius varieornatus]|uniref:DNA fragmentation factor 40 C-terminal domain-containing protein n=1 Tax=Ramazzottius varieornatus TaxID=947166 RepID=A0A1D1UN11_RAMVA|nr:hypothetical protein RvY_00539 [Ramazzottius varieornatus]
MSLNFHRWYRVGVPGISRPKSHAECSLQTRNGSGEEAAWMTPPIPSLFSELAAALVNAEFHRSYVQMIGTVPSPFCDKNGRIKCSGAWNKKACLRQAQVSPYRNWVQRCELTNWNFEHVTTLKSMIDFIVEKGKNMPDGKKFSWSYFYKMLFMRPNVKLVERSCNVGGEVGRKTVDPAQGLIDVDVQEQLDAFAHPHA